MGSKEQLASNDRDGCTNRHDTDYRLTGIVKDLKVGYHYDFDANNRVTGFTNFAEGAWSHTFGYDALNRLTAANSPGLGNQSFGYDAGSNRKTHNASAYTIATGSNRLMAEGGRSYTYTPTGNVKTITGYGIGGGDPIFANGFEHAPLPVTTYSYDGMDRLVGAAGPGFVAGYQIGPDGTRIRKTANGETTRFVYGPGGMLLSEHRHTPARWTHYLWLNGEPVALVRNNTLYWIQTDHLGRPEGITNSNKQRVWRANLRAFDRRVIDDDIGGFQLGFPGQYHDTETGHAYNVHRDYHPATGRYLQSDPIGLAGGLNTYAYTGSNPANLIDPLGLEGMGPWNNGQMSNVAGGANPCVAGAIGNSLLNITPVIGLAKEMFIDQSPNYIDYAGPLSSSGALAMELYSQSYNSSAQERIADLQRLDRNRREQGLIVNRIRANSDISRILSSSAKTVGGLAMGIEIFNLAGKIKNCGCSK